MTGRAYIAVDIGASSGRVILGRLTTGGGPEMQVVHRFPNGVVELDGALRWDITALLEQVLTGLTAAAAAAAAAGDAVVSIGVDTWAVDYGLLDRNGKLAGVPFSYRDERSRTTVCDVHRSVSPADLYAATGIQYLQFNTIYQLAAEKSLDDLQALLIPDLLAYFLTGQRQTEVTNASTTGLLNATTGQWDQRLFEALQLPRELFPPLRQPGQTTGVLLPAVAQRTGLDPATTVVSVGSHDTASAVAAVPAGQGPFAYISSGTWSLVGVELPTPVLTEESRALNFTNERGLDGTVRYLRNVGGLWLLSECQRTWADEGIPLNLPDLLAAAAREPVGGPRINVDDPSFIAPCHMPDRIRAAVRAAGDPAPATPAALVRCILDSLAASYARTLAQAMELSGLPVEAVHIVGGGSQNRLLCQLTANATGLPVTAGPVEATALGNILAQAQADGTVPAGLPQLRQLVRMGADLQHYDPQPA
ncbi:MAG: rhamnulokinase [Micrococcaceae bacterium]|nr:rhamnulokinase [Micrococcaceae bacterium]